MRNRFAPTTIWAFQTAIAIALAFLIGHYFHLQKSYWAVLTAILLISQTWGESVKKALERITMTIVGGTIGTVLYFSLSHSPHIFYIAIIVFTFCLVYCIGYSFQGTAFFVTIFVVFLFAILGQWNFKFLEIRIYETIVGAMCAVFTSILVFPCHGKSTLQRLFNDYVAQAREVIALSFNFMMMDGNTPSISSLRDQLFQKYRLVVDAYKTSSYEMFFKLTSRKQAKMLIDDFSLLLHYVTSMLETSVLVDIHCFSNDAQNILMTAKTYTFTNIQKIMDLINNTKPTTNLVDIKIKLNTLIELSITDMQKSASFQTTMLNNLSLIYYLMKINEILLQIEIKFAKF